MAIVYFLVIFLAMLIIYTIISTVIKLSLYLTTRVKYENIRLLIPVILSLIIWAIIAFLCIFTTNKYLNTDVFNQIIETYVLKESLVGILKPTIIFVVSYLIIGIILQSLAYFSVNIKFENCLSYIRYYLFKILKITPKQQPNNVIEKEPIESLTLNRSILASIFSTILIIFFVSMFVIIGLTIGNKFTAQI